MKNLLFLTLFTFLSLCLIAQTDILPPNLTTPDNGAIDQMPDVKLDWYASSGVGPVTYTVEIATNIEFENAVSFTTSTTELNTSNLKFGENYFWRVNAIDNVGTSDWSDIFSFTVFSRLLLDSPLNGAVDQMPDVVLSREEKVDNVEYSGFNIMQCQLDTAYSLSTQNIDLTDEDLNSIYFMDENLGWIVGESGTILAYDNEVWSLETIVSGITNEDTTISTGLNSIHNGFIVGNEGTFLRYDADMWILEPIEVESGSKKVKITEDLLSVFALSDEDIWAVGPDGYIIHKGDSEIWEVVVSNTDEDLYSVYFEDENNGWAVGTGDFVLYYDGTEWALEANPAERDLYSVYFLDMNHGWACGKLGTMIFYDGTQWIEMESNTGKDLNSISMLNPNKGWAVGKDGTLVNFDGHNWFETTSTSLNTLNSIFVVDAENIWIAGEEGTVISKIGEGFNSDAMIIFNTSGDSSNVHMADLLFGERYYWRLRAIHGADTSSWSSARYFSTIDGINLDEPAQNAINQNPDVKLTWLEITGIDSYIYQVCKDPDFTFPCISGFVDTNLVIIPNLFFGETYYWRVQAASFADTTDWSEVRNFEVINTVLLTSPANGASGISNLPTLIWEWITIVDEYEVRWWAEDFTYSDTAFVPGIYTGIILYNPLLVGKDYFWKVRAMNNGDTTNWSDTWQFHVGAQSIGDQLLDDNNISIYPNPAKDRLTLEINSIKSTKINVMIIDLMGKIAMKQSFTVDQGISKNLMQLDVLNKGIYLIKIQSGNEVYSEKLIID